MLSTFVGGFPVLALRSPGGYRAFVNACPHQFLPLDQRSSSVLSSDGSRLMCSNHQAEFRAADGTGVAGHGLGCTLSRIPTRELDGDLVVDGH